MAFKFVHVPITPRSRGTAEAFAKTLPIYPGSHRAKAANLVGSLGEVIVQEWLLSRGYMPISVRSIDQDMTMQCSSGQELHFDIKTKDRTVPPRPDYEATVPAYVYDKQTPHYCVFVSLYRERSSPAEAFSDAYIVGTIARDRFHAIKYFEPMGRKPNGAVFFCDAWNVKIGDLDEPLAFPPPDLVSPPRAAARIDEDRETS